MYVYMFNIYVYMCNNYYADLTIDKNLIVAGMDWSNQYSGTLALVGEFQWQRRVK